MQCRAALPNHGTREVSLWREWWARGSAGGSTDPNIPLKGGKARAKPRPPGLRRERVAKDVWRTKAISRVHGAEGTHSVHCTHTVCPCALLSCRAGANSASVLSSAAKMAFTLPRTRTVRVALLPDFHLWPRGPASPPRPQATFLWHAVMKTPFQKLDEIVRAGSAGAAPNHVCRVG